MKTEYKGWDVGGKLGYWSGLNSTNPSKRGFATTTMDLRRTYVTFGQTIFGRIGVGYLYADWIPQITYTSPNMGGFQLTAGLIQAMDVFNFSGAPTSVTLNGHDAPGFQAKATYDWKGSVAGRVWAGVTTEKSASTGTAPAKGYEHHWDCGRTGRQA